MKVVDMGTYRAIVGEVVEDYVPHGVIPGEYGDYVDFDIDENGVITNWPKHPDIRQFLNQGDE